jgi:hypothetical protein
MLGRGVKVSSEFREPGAALNRRGRGGAGAVGRFGQTIIPLFPSAGSI